jgi:transposase
MLQITPQMKILVAVEPADFRRGIDGLARLCQETLQHDPFAGAVFVFRNRRGTALKLLMYDGQGFWLCHKRQAPDYPQPVRSCSGWFSGKATVRSLAG